MFYYAKAIFSTAVKLVVAVFYYPYYDMSQINFELSKRAYILKKKALFIRRCGFNSAPMNECRSHFAHSFYRFAQNLLTVV